jgi:hypothetical protein
MPSAARTSRLALAILALVLAILAFMATPVVLNPWRRSDASIRARLISLTPLGSSIDEVRPILDRHGWNELGYQKTQPPPAQKPFLGGAVGGYQGIPWYTTVRAFWEFDENDKLKDIRIDRWEDSP